MPQIGLERNPAFRPCCSCCKTPEWQAEVARIEGYTPLQSGEVLSMRKVLPWWDFAARKVSLK